jgi:SAM-dependent methyltransferase
VTGLDAGLTESDRNEVLLHLQRQYRGVFTNDAIARHLEDHVGINDAHVLLDHLVTRRPDARRVLDVGSGYGSFVLLARAGGLDARGVDLAEFELRTARRRLARARPADDADEVYVHGSALDLPFESDSFDAVTLWNVLEHVPDHRRALQEAARVLRPGGGLFLIAPNYAAFRREAHYHVPWPPLLPKRIAARYLRVLGRDPRFFLDDVYPCTLAGVQSTLTATGLQLRDGRQDKLADPQRIVDPRARRVVLVAKRARLLGVVRLLVRAAASNPLASTIHIEAVKPG